MEVATMIGTIKEQKQSMILVIDARRVNSVIKEAVVQNLNAQRILIVQKDMFVLNKSVFNPAVVAKLAVAMSVLVPDQVGSAFVLRHYPGK